MNSFNFILRLFVYVVVVCPVIVCAHAQTEKSFVSLDHGKVFIIITCNVCIFIIHIF